MAKASPQQGGASAPSQQPQQSGGASAPQPQQGTPVFKDWASI